MLTRLFITFFAALVLFEPGYAEEPGYPRNFSVQFTDNFLLKPDWRDRLLKVKELGADFVRIDVNWNWVEKSKGVYDWTVYDAFVAELKRDGLRPLFELNRPNPNYSGPVTGAAPTGVAAVEAFSKWAAAAAVRYKTAGPIWEIWNEPDHEMFWPPKADPGAYVTLAKSACLTMKAAQPDAVVISAGTPQPTVWQKEKPILRAEMNDKAFLACLDGISLHTHRFGQTPETISRDYAVLRQQYLDSWPADVPRKPIYDTEWGDSVYRGGISEATQAAWLPRMFLINLMEGVNFTNWYCFQDVGANPDEIEDHFGLVSLTGAPRLSYKTFKVLVRQLSGLTFERALIRFDVPTAKGNTALLFCDSSHANCIIAAWTSDDLPAGTQVDLPDWSIASVTDFLGNSTKREELGEAGGKFVLSPKVAYFHVTRK